MAARICFTVSDEEKAEIEEYLRRRRRWRRAGDLARDATWQFIYRNRPGGHRKAQNGHRAKNE